MKLKIIYFNHFTAMLQNNDSNLQISINFPKIKCHFEQFHENPQQTKDQQEKY